MSHLLARQAPEVPSHVKAGLQRTLQGVPVSEYSPLDNHSGAMDRLAVRPCSIKTTFVCTLHLLFHACKCERDNVSDTRGRDMVTQSSRADSRHCHALHSLT